jgi:UDP:flavonoid glycosyltransferase YjiC (YdhE family)
VRLDTVPEGCALCKPYATVLRRGCGGSARCAGGRMGRRRLSSFILCAMRILAACSLGGAGHFNPLVPFLRAARCRGDEVLTVGPPALREMVESAGYPFRAGGEPPEEQVAAIRERLPVATAAEASVLGNRELFGRLATAAMLAGMEEAWGEWVPELVLHDPTEYASAVLAARTRTPIAQVAISLAEAEAGSIAVAAPALQEHRQGLVSELRAQPYLTRFPASIDPSPFVDTVRFHEPSETPVSLPDWWRGSDAPLIYMTFGTVLGYMSIAAETYGMALQAVEGMNARVLLTVGRRFDASTLGSGEAGRRAACWVVWAMSPC